MQREIDYGLRQWDAMIHPVCHEDHIHEQQKHFLIRSIIQTLTCLPTLQRWVNVL